MGDDRIDFEASFEGLHALTQDQSDWPWPTEEKPFDPEIETLPFQIGYEADETFVAEAGSWEAAKDACKHMVGAGEYEELFIWYAPERRRVASCRMDPISEQPTITGADCDFRRMEGK